MLLRVLLWPALESLQKQKYLAALLIWPANHRLHREKFLLYSRRESIAHLPSS